VIALASQVKPVDFVKLLDDVKALMEKYSMPRGIILVPDKLEILIQRNSNNFHLSYRESFTYLPNHVLDVAIPVTINTLVNTGFPRESITRISNNCVGLEINGSYEQVLGAVLNEILIQKRLSEDELVSFLSFVARMRKALTDLSDLGFEWNSETEKTFYGNLENLFKVMQEHPSFLSEMQAIVTKYTNQKEKSESETREDKPV
jgi:hypothetical protein